MNDCESLIRQGMARIKVTHVSELANRIGLSKQILGRKMKIPSTFKPDELKRLAMELHWSKEEIGDFIMKL